MGACASKPKDFDKSIDSAPPEAPVSPKKAEHESETYNNTQEKNNRGENQDEAPLVDLSEKKKEAEEQSNGTKPADAEPAAASEENKAVTSSAAAEVTEKKVEAAIEPAEKAKDKSEAPLVTV